MRRLLLVGAIVMAVPCVLAPGVALADDSSVYQTYVSRDADFAKLGRQVWGGLRTWAQSGRKRSGPPLRALARTVQTCDELSSAIDAQQASSDHGTRAKAAALASVKLIGRSAVVTAKGVRAGTAGHRATANRLLRKADRILARSGEQEKVARREFRAAGVQIKP